VFNPLNAELNPICHFLALLGAHYIFHVSRIRVNFLTTFIEQPKLCSSDCHFLLTHTLIIIKINMQFVKIVPVSLRVGKMQLSNVITSFLIQWKTTLYDTAKVFVQYKSYQLHRSIYENDQQNETVYDNLLILHCSTCFERYIRSPSSGASKLYVQLVLRLLSLDTGQQRHMRIIPEAVHTVQMLLMTISKYIVRNI